MKKYILLVLCLLLVACKKEEKPIESENVLKSQINEFEYGDLYSLKDIFMNSDITFKDDYLEISSLGENEMVIEYTKEDTLYEEKFTFNVVDTTPPLIWLGKSYSIYMGDTDNFANRITCADNHDQKPKCYVTGDYDPNEAGSYLLTYVAEDSSGNKEQTEFTLNVIDKSLIPPKEDTTQEDERKTNIADVISKYKSENTMIGIDVSKYQGDINWQEVKNAGVEFAMIRLGLGYDIGEGDVLKLDDKFEQNINGALDNNIKVGIYFYSYASDTKMAKRHAKFVIKNIKNYDVTMPIAFDWENFSSFNEYGISLYDLRSMANSFGKTIEKAGYTPLQYGSKNYLNAFWNPVMYDIWLAHYGVEQSDYDKSYVMWQLCQDGIVPGIDHAVDIDVYYK